MDEQSRPAGPEDGQGTEDTGKNAPEEYSAGGSAAEQPAKQRSAYLDPRGSEGTRELRDTARRRRDAEEKLQQHLMEAKEHVPNEFHEHHSTGHPHAPDSEHGRREGKPEHGRPEIKDDAGEETGDEA
ncbi:hypothetical protein ACFVVC_14145 [Pseudarthrobacter sp. NPDC058196]|uniref:hypothetical protein n=1 Tax=Pseudarthrobacter sp. NPDC058196 TaxID=3346376 RepID=UPI0036D80CBD